MLRAIPGAADVTVEQVTGQPVLQIAVDRDAIARYGIPARSVLDAVEAVGVRHVGEIREGDRALIDVGPGGLTLRREAPETARAAAAGA